MSARPRRRLRRFVIRRLDAQAILRRVHVDGNNLQPAAAFQRVLAAIMIRQPPLKRREQKSSQPSLRRVRRLEEPRGQQLGEKTLREILRVRRRASHESKSK